MKKLMITALLACTSMQLIAMEEAAIKNITLFHYAYDTFVKKDIHTLSAEDLTDIEKKNYLSIPYGNENKSALILGTQDEEYIEEFHYLYRMQEEAQFGKKS